MNRIATATTKLITPVLLTALLAACATITPPSVERTNSISINEGYRAGSLDIPVTPVPSLDQMMSRIPERSRSGPQSNEDRLRQPALRDAAMSYGAQGGLAWESRAINQMLLEQSPEISRIYDFQRVMVRGPDNVMILPPVISEMNETWETSEAGRALRVADTYYEIIEQARFASNAPLWQSYLIRNYTTPNPPPDILLPSDRNERGAWQASVAQGWEMGRQQAQDIFKADMERLQRDFTGMIRYKALLEQGLVSPPVVADARMGTTGTGSDMRVNDRSIRITQDPSLQVSNPENWGSAPTTTYPSGQTTGLNPNSPPPVCPPGMTPVTPQVASTPACAPYPVPRPGTQSAGTRAAWE